MIPNILQQTFESTNFKPNSTTYQLTLTIDADLTDINEINSILCNNGSRYKSMDGLAYISTNSTSIVYSPNFMYLFKFIAEYGDISTTGYKEGIWRCIGKKGFITN